jgi:hypothetical protein
MDAQLSFDEIAPRLPTRYEDLDEAFRGSLRPNQRLIDLVKAAFKSITITGGIRFLPVYGLSGSGKSCATLELGTHLPQVAVVKLDQAVVANPDLILESIKAAAVSEGARPLVAVIDQFEETAAGKEEIPTRFVEKLASLDTNYQTGQSSLFGSLQVQSFSANLWKQPAGDRGFLLTHRLLLKALHAKSGRILSARLSPLITAGRSLPTLKY